MKELWVVVVLIWYICVNENYLFTRADYKRITFNFTENLNMSFSCNNYSRIRIVNISVDEESMPCKNTTCDLNRFDTKSIHEACNGRNDCVLKMEWSTPCIREYGYYNVSYVCNATCNFEDSKCGFNTSSATQPRWIYVKGSNISSVIQGPAKALQDHTMNTQDGHFMIIKSEGIGNGKMKMETLHHQGHKCLSFWYYCARISGNANGDVTLNILQKETVFRPINLKADSTWHFYKVEIYMDENDYISFRSDFRNTNNILVGIDDVSLSIISNIMNKCEQDDVPEVKRCLSTGRSFEFDACPSFFLKQLSINFMYDIYRISQSPQVCHEVNTITQSITEYCAASDKWKTCTFNFKNITKDDTCLQPDKKISIEYLCLDASVPSSYEITTHESQSAKYTSLSRQTTTTSSQTEDIPDNFQSSSPSSTPAIGIVVGVVLSVVAMSVCLVVAVIYFRRSRYFEKKANSIVVKENNHSDYTGHQNVAFSPEVNGNTQTDYCEIRTSKHNEQYHDISDTFRPLINTEKDVYSEIANVVNSPNSNPNASTNYQHQYITLDLNATGFNRSNSQTNLNNESKNNHNSNEKTSLTGGDDYAILDPDDLNESKNNTPKVLPFSDNYVVLDPNETGFNRQENTDRVCNYDLATPTVTSEDPYDVSKDETYDTSSNNRHKEKENNIYNHTVDNVYDTAGNQRKKEENDGTYDHFFGQKSEDDYDISKPI